MATQPKVTAPATNSTTRTTIIRRDAEGNVVDVHQYNSAVNVAKKAQQNRTTEPTAKMQQMRAQEVINYKDVSHKYGAIIIVIYIFDQLWCIFSHLLK